MHCLFYIFIIWIFYFLWYFCFAQVLGGPPLALGIWLKVDKETVKDLLTELAKYGDVSVSESIDVNTILDYSAIGIKKVQMINIEGGMDYPIFWGLTYTDSKQIRETVWPLAWLDFWNKLFLNPWNHTGFSEIPAPDGSQ